MTTQDCAKSPWFTTTHWSVVAAAGDRSAPGGAKALERLCARYWYPLYTFVRRGQNSAHDAQDLTQSFFAWLLENNHLRLADPDKGRFRSFLLVRLKHFLSDEQKKARAQKRGAGVPLVSLDVEAAEELYRLEPVAEFSPEKTFDRCWALAILEQTVARLRQEYMAAGRGQLFEELRHFQPGSELLTDGSSASSYAAVAERLGLTESAVKSAIWRLRQHHRDLLREEIAQTVASPSDVVAEIRYLIEILSS